MRRGAIVLVIALIVVVIAVSHPTVPGAAAPANDEVVFKVSGTLAAGNGVTTSPLPLSPTFVAATTDYVLWCASGVNAEQFTLKAASGASLTVAYQGPGGVSESQTGSTVSVAVALGENQAIELVTSQAGAGSYWIRCLPHDFPRMTTNEPSPASAPAGYYVTSNITGATNGTTSSNYAMILNQNGTPVWYQRTGDGGINVTPLSNEEFAWAPNLGPGLGANPNGAYDTYNLATQAAGTLKGPLGYTDPHELQQLSNGDDVMLTSPLVPNIPPSQQQIIDCVIEIFNPATNQLVWKWDAWADGGLRADQTEEPLNVPYASYSSVDDAFHCNSVDVNQGMTSVLVSMRETSAIYEIPVIQGVAEGGPAAWKIGGNGITDTNQTAWIPFSSLSPKDPEGGFSMQDDARIQAVDSSGRPIQISLFDDHANVSGHEVGVGAGGARGAIYNLAYSGTSTAPSSVGFVKQVPVSAPPASLATGGFRIVYDSSGNPVNYVIAWGIQVPDNGSGFTTFDANGNVLLQQTFPNGEWNYRSIFVPASDLNLNDLRNAAGLPRPTYPVPPTWSPVPTGVLDSGPALTSWSPTRFDLSGRGLDGELWHAYWTGSGWSGWEGLGGLIMPGTAPAAVAWGPNRIDIFVEGLDSALWHLVWTGSGWFGWQPLGGGLSGSPPVSSWGVNRLDVVVRGSDSAIWHMSWGGTVWSGWESLGGVSTSSPAVASWTPGRVDIITQGTDAQAWHQWWQNGWSGWAESLGGNLSTGPAAGSVASGELDVLSGGPAGIPERLPYQKGWQLWQPMGQSPTPYPPIGPTTGFAPALVHLMGTSTEESCLTLGTGGVECTQASAGTPPAQQVVPPASMSPSAAQKL